LFRQGRQAIEDNNAEGLARTNVKNDDGITPQ
jgi:hypothetical protein